MSDMFQTMENKEDQDGEQGNAGGHSVPNLTLGPGPFIIPDDEHQKEQNVNPNVFKKKKKRRL